MYVQDGGVLNLSQISPVNSIQPNSVLDISGSGLVIVPNDLTAVMSAYTNALRITAYGGLGTVGIDYNNTNVGKTMLFAITPPAPPPTNVVWNPAANPSGTGKWNENANWTGGVRPASVTKVNFNVVGAISCTVTNAAVADYVVMGDNGPGGTLIITNGGSLACTGGDDWNSIGMNNTGLMVVENGGSASFGNHLWIGFDAVAEGTLIMNGGTVSVGQMFGLGWNGGKGTAQIKGGTLNLSQWSASSPGSIVGASVLDVAGTGKVVITGNQFTSVSNYVSAGKITANGGPNVFYFYDSGANKTTISAVLLPPPQQSITAVSVSGGNVTITYQTTHQHTYHVEGTPSLSPTAWAPVAGSTNAATGAPVTFTFPAGSGPMFYRTVSP